MLAIVTGASRGLGRRCARHLAAAGADLLLVARDSMALARVAAEVVTPSTRIQVSTLGCDLADPDAPEILYGAAERLGGADILINNAAVQGPIGRAWEVSWRDFEAALQLDFLVPVQLCRAFIPDMKAKGRGWIVNISGGGATGARPMFSAYGAAKTALVRFSEVLALETAPFGIRVNAVAPGAFASNMAKAVSASATEAGTAEVTAARSLLDRGDETNAETAARLVTYLTLGAGRFVTGKLISAVWDRWDVLHRNPAVLAHKEVFTLRRVVPEQCNLTLDG
jgi:NAD(P)-dependent dehydrogenase (short-subunit alcohol dehydrogenase family)